MTFIEMLLENGATVSVENKIRNVELLRVSFECFAIRFNPDSNPSLSIPFSSKDAALEEIVRGLLHGQLSDIVARRGK